MSSKDSTRLELEEREYLRQRAEPAPGDPNYLHLSDLKLALEPHQSSQPIRVLDFGCGGSPYRSLFPHADYRRADFGNLAGLDYVIGHDSRVEESDGSFDLILSSQVAEHATSPASYFAEAARLLKPGGLFLCSTHGAFYDHGCPYDFQRWTADGLTRDLKQADMEVVSMQKMTTGPRAVLFLFYAHLGEMRGASPGSLTFGLSLLRKAVWIFRRWFHRECDRLFSSRRVVSRDEAGHGFYIGLFAVARKPGK